MGVAEETASPQRNFTLTLTERIRGLAGAPAYSLRLRSIEDDEQRFVAKVAAALRQPRAELERVLARIDLERLNRTIEKHNRYFPIEANLPLDVRTGQALFCGQPFTPRATWTRERLLDEARKIPVLLGAEDQDHRR